MSVPALTVEFMPGAGPLTVAGDVYLEVPSTGGNASTPDTGALDLASDLDVAVELTMDDWSPTSTRWLVAKFGGAGARSYLFQLNTNGTLALQWSADGTNSLSANSVVALQPTPARRAVRATLDANDGAGNRVITFYEGPTTSGPWTTLNTITTAGTTSIFNSTSVLEVGNALAGLSTPLGGRIHAMVLRSTIGGTIVADPDFTAQAIGATSFADSTGKTWTVGAPAEIAGFDWVDISDRLLDASWSWGRGDERGPFEPGDARMVLRNEDRELDPDYAAGSWFGDLNPRVPFRLLIDGDDAFYGFVEQGFEQTYYPGDTWATCTVKLVDLLEAIGSTRLPRTALEAEVLFDNPAAYWRLDERDGTQMADSSGNGRHGRYDNSVLGEDSLIVGDGTSVQFPHVGDNRGEWSGEGLPEGAPCSIEAWVKTDRNLAAVKAIVVAQRDATLTSALFFGIEESAFGSPNGELLINFFGLGTGYKARGSSRIDDDEPHHVVVTIAGNTPADVVLYVDGQVETKTTVTAGNPGAWTDRLLWTVGNFTNTGAGDFGFEGLIDEVAIHPVALSADRVLAHYQAGATAYSGETIGARIDRVLDLLGVPDGLRDIADGDTTAGPANYDGAQVGSYLEALAESEQGFLYVDHRNGGKLTFKGRYSRLTDTRSTTSQATFTDDDPTPGGEYRFKDIHPAPNGISSIVNEVQVTWPGGREVVSDAASIAAYGPRSRSITTEAPTPSAAQSAGQWLVTRFAQPQSRVRGLDVSPGTDPDVWPAVLDLRVGDRITVKWQPQGLGAQISNELTVEGIRGQLMRGVEWTTTYSLSNADDTQVWIWGTATWGETTVWG